MPEEAFKVHGFHEFLSDKEILINRWIFKLVKDKKIIIHNASFDLGFLDGELKSIQKEKIDKNFVIDSLEVARIISGTSNLDAL